MSVIQFQFRRDTSANWTSNNPTLLQGEYGLETNTLNMKLGDGSTAWNSLGYYSTKMRTGSGAPAGGLGTVGDLYIDSVAPNTLYLKTAVSTWTSQGNLQGTQGIQGIQGNPGVVQTVTAADATLVAGGTAADPTLRRNAITGPINIASASNTSTVNAQTGTGSVFVMDTSPALSGNPTAPTATLGDNDTSIATTAFVNAEIASDAPNVTLAASGTSPNANAATLTGQQLVLQIASTTFAGLQTAADKIKENNMYYDIVAQGGADPAGSVDATSIIQTAINTVGAAGGGEVFIPKGTFKTSSAITVTNPFVTIRGASRVASKIVPTHATGNIFTISAQFVRFESIRIEPTSFLTRTAGYAFEFTSTANNGSCQWVDILGMWSAIRATGQLCRLEDMNIRECGYGAVNGCMILIDAFTDQYLSKLVFDNGTVAPNAPQATFSGIRITNLSSLLMSDCQVIHCQVGLDASPASTNTIPSIYCMNTFFDNGTIGARFISGSGNIFRCRFMGVWFSSNSTAGVQLNGAVINGLDFIGCEFYGNPFGIDAIAATEWSVRASRFAGNTTNAIRTTAGAGHSFSISDNTVGNVSGFGANAQGINIQAGTYKRYQILDNRGLESNTTPGIIDLGVVGATDQKNVGNNMGALLKGAIATLATPLSVPVTTETLVLNARIPANGVSVGQVFRIRTLGVMSGANAVTWRVKVGAAGTVAGDANAWVAIAAPVGAANARHGAEIWLTVRSLGGPGSVQAEGVQHSSTATVMTWQASVVGVAATAAATTTADWFIDVSLSQTVGTSLIQQAVIEAL